MTLARLGQLGIATGVENVPSDGESENGSDQHIGRPVVTGKHTADTHRGYRSISQYFHPRLRVFVSDNCGHGPGKHGMAGPGMMCSWRGGARNLRFLPLDVACRREIASAHKREERWTRGGNGDF